MKILEIPKNMFRRYIMVFSIQFDVGRDTFGAVYNINWGTLGLVRLVLQANTPVT